MRLPVHNMAGEVVGEADLSDEVFGITPNAALMHQAMIIYMGNQRKGTAATKTRGMVSGGGQKPWRQKGTGHARQGSRRAPHWKGGGVTFGPHPRSYRRELPRKMRRLALRSALSVKALEQSLLLLDQLSLPEPRTKDIINMLNGLYIDRSTLIVLPEPDQVVSKSAHNLPEVRALPVQSLNSLEVMRHHFVVMPLDAARKIEATLSLTGLSLALAPVAEEEPGSEATTEAPNESETEGAPQSETETESEQG